MEIYKIIDAENKGVSVIESCENELHLKVAQLYINRFRQLHKLNNYSANKLQLLLNNKRKKMMEWKL